MKNDGETIIDFVGALLGGVGDKNQIQAFS